MNKLNEAKTLGLQSWICFFLAMLYWEPLHLSATVSAESSVLNPSSAAKFNPMSMTYVLQADALAGNREKAVELLRHSGGDLVVIDAAYSCDAEGLWTQEEIKTIRGGKNGRKVAAYLSIGEAEDYRPYWKKTWNASQNKLNSDRPLFLCQENPEWKGNYRVKYWHKEWQDIILAAADKVVSAGFDGLYLDIVDGFEYFEQEGNQTVDNRRNPETGNTYRQDMIRWVMQIAERTRSKAGNEFIIIPQNGEQLLADPNYLATISAIGCEDLFTDGRRKQKPEDVKYRIAFLKNAIQANKPILLIEYPKNSDLRAYVIKQAKAYGFTLLLTDRELKTLGGDK